MPRLAGDAVEKRAGAAVVARCIVVDVLLESVDELRDRPLDLLVLLVLHAAAGRCPVRKEFVEFFPVRCKLRGFQHHRILDVAGDGIELRGTKPGRQSHLRHVNCLLMGDGRPILGRPRFTVGLPHLEVGLGPPHAVLHLEGFGLLPVLRCLGVLEVLVALGTHHLRHAVGCALPGRRRIATPVEAKAAAPLSRAGCRPDQGRHADGHCDGKCA